MRYLFRYWRHRYATSLLAALAAAAICVLLARQARRPEFENPSGSAFRTPAGYPQLIAIERMPMEGEMCDWVPATADTRLVAASSQERLSARAPGASSEAVTNAVDADRAPVRVIRDGYPTYSAVGVDTSTDEVFLQDENLFGLKVFNRLDNTPPTAEFTEPKRVVGGMNTKLEFNCGLYIDPKTGDVYSVNNDTMNKMVVFPRAAKGNVTPMRELKTPHGTYGIAVDEGTQELYLTVEHINSVVVYRKLASGDEKPLRILQGDRTRLEDPHGIALDTKNKWMFVANHGNASDSGVAGSGRFERPSISVYPLEAIGDTAPLRVIEGPKTQLNWPAAIYLDEEHGELFVANDAADSILIFRENDSGDAAPLRVVKGAKTGIKNPTGVFVDTKNQELWVSNMGNYSATVYPRGADGDIATLRTIRSAPRGKLAQAIGNPGAAAYDSRREEILVPN